MFGGHPRQILPVVCHGNQAHIVKACIQSSSLWDQIQQIKLITNMRLEKKKVDFPSFLLTIGNGTAEVHTDRGDSPGVCGKQH